MQQILAVHDPAYVQFRSQLVPVAEKYADEHAGPRPPKREGFLSGREACNAQYEAWCIAWNLLFHTYIEHAVAKHYGKDV